jgi:hypothetical protein
MLRRTRKQRDDLDLLAADPWLRELVIAAGGRPPSDDDIEERFRGAQAKDYDATRRWRRKYVRAAVAWSIGRRAKAIRLFGECAQMVSALRDEGESNVARGFVAYVEQRFRCIAHDDCLAHEMMAHDCWLEHPERAR